MSNGLCSPYFFLFSVPVLYPDVACAIRSHACEKKHLRSSHSEAGRPGGVNLFQSTPPVHMDKRDQQFTVTGSILHIKVLVKCEALEPRLARSCRSLSRFL